MWHIYLARCADDTIYCGIAKDVAGRIERHNQGRGARYTRTRRPVVLIHVERAASHGAALRREAQIKKMGRSRKEALCVRARKGAARRIGRNAARKCRLK
jgi:putative endonuclease